MKTIVIANWKMNRPEGLESLIAKCAEYGRTNENNIDVVLCPPATLLAQVAELAANAPVKVGGQDCSPHAGGAYTGDVSAGLLKDAGAQYVLVGHSERRNGHQETSEQVRQKAEMVLKSGLTPVICIGESLEERTAGGEKWKTVLADQLQHSLPLPEKGPIIIAYEPVWAIGTGKTPTGREISDTHNFIASRLPSGTPGARPPILYGGSVNGRNAESILACQGVSGVLVGGASLKSNEFCAILEAAALPNGSRA